MTFTNSQRYIFRPAEVVFFNDFADGLDVWKIGRLRDVQQLPVSHKYIYLMPLRISFVGYDAVGKKIGSFRSVHIVRFHNGPPDIFHVGFFNRFNTKPYFEEPAFQQHAG